MESFLQDIDYGARQIRRLPGFTSAVVLTLALAIGANTALFTMLYAVLLKSLPYPHPEQIFDTEAVVSYPDFRSFQAQTNAFQALSCFTGGGFTLTGHGAPKHVSAYQVTPGFFAVLRMPALVGRPFTRNDLREDTHVAVLSYSFWQHEFGKDREVIGKTLTLNRVPFRVIGVMPSEFTDAAHVDLWAPLELTAQERRRNFSFLQLLGRLKTGVKLVQAQQQIDTVQARLAGLYPSEPNRGPPLLGYQQDLTGSWQQPLYLLFGAGCLLLLISCLNIASLLLARGVGRVPEIAMRSVMGASRRRIMRQLMTESALLGIFGVAVGLVAGEWMLHFLRIAAAGAGMPRIGTGVNASVTLAFTLALLIVTVLVFGLVPSWEASRVNLSQVVQSGIRISQTHGRRRLLEGMIICELALAVALAIGGGLLLRSYSRLTSLPLGFRPHHLLTFSTNLAPRGPSVPYSSINEAEGQASRKEHEAEFVRQAMERLKTIPGVQSAAAAMALPFQGLMVGKVEATGSSAQYTTLINYVSPGYFRTLGITQIRGRDFSQQDRMDTPSVVIISSNLARKLWPAQSPIGRRLILPYDPHKTPYTVVGEVENSMQYGPMGASAFGMNMFAQPEVSLDIEQAPSRHFGVALRISLPPASIAPAVHGIFLRLNPTEPVTNLETMQQTLGSLLAKRRFYLNLLVGVAALSLALMTAGVYGVMAFIMGARTHEIGIRMALGATPSAILGMVLKRTAALAMIGVGCGLGLSLLLARLLSGLLYGVGSADAVTLGSVAGLALTAALVAAYQPARRAAKQDPLAALRYE